MTSNGLEENSMMAEESGDQKVGSTSRGANSPEGTVQDEKFEETTFPEGGTRAWLVAASCAGVLFCTFGYVNAFGVYQEYYQTHQLRYKGPSDISWIGSLQAFFLFGGALFGGPLFDRFGEKVCLLLAHAPFQITPCKITNL